MAQSAILEWATEFFCALDDHDMLADLLRLRQCSAGPDLDDFESVSRPRPPEEPLCLVFYKLRKGLGELGPAYLGLVDTDNAPSSGQPWTSPFSSPTRAPPRRREPQPAGKGAQQLDIPALVCLLINVEKARRRSAAALLSQKRAARPMAEQSERWQHHFAKRNIAAEAKFENILVALKELVVLRVAIDEGVAQIGELRNVLRTADARGQLAQGAAGSSLNAALCLAVLNLMFPLDPLHAGGQASPSTGSQQRYAFALRHVPNPRMELHQLLCEVEAWISGDDRITTSVGRHSNGALDSDDGYDPPQRKRARTGDVHTAANCPTWLAAARGLAWGQLRLSCLAYLRDAQQKITEQYLSIHPWTALASSPTLADSPASPKMRDLGEEGWQGIQGDNEQLLKGAVRQTSPDATVLERIVRHSRLVHMRFSPHTAYEMLSR